MNREKHDIGLVGLEVMGQNLVLNMAGHGHRVAVPTRVTETTRRFTAADCAGGRGISRAGVSSSLSEGATACARYC